MIFLPKYSSNVGSSRLRMFVYTENIGPYLLLGRFQLIQINKVILQVFKRINILLRNRSSIIVLEKELFPWAPYWLESIFLHKPLILDYDDGIFVKYHNTVLSKKIPKLSRRADLVICGSRNLELYFRHLGARTALIPTPIIDHSVRKTNSVLFKSIIWIGQPGSVYSLNEYIDEIVRFCEDYGVIFNVIGVSHKDIASSSNHIAYHEWSAKNEYQLLAESDFGLMPLIDGEFEQYKCSYKLLQYLSVGLYPLFDGLGENALIAQELSLIPREKFSWYEYLTLAYEEKFYTTEVALPERYWLSSTSKVRSKLLSSFV